MQNSIKAIAYRTSSGAIPYNSPFSEIEAWAKSNNYCIEQEISSNVAIGIQQSKALCELKSFAQQNDIKYCLVLNLNELSPDIKEQKQTVDDLKNAGITIIEIKPESQQNPTLMTDKRG